MKKLLCILGVTLTVSLLSSCNGDGLVLSDNPEDFTNEKIQSNMYEDGADNASSFDGKKEVKGCVYLCGAVRNVGIYEFSEGTRLYEIIEMAGGLDEEADADAVNLAMEVSDAQQIRIP